MNQRGRGPQTLSKAVARLTKPIFGKRGLADGAIVREWDAIAGADMAEHSAPEKIVYPSKARGDGTLHLRVDSGSFATALQHDEPQVVERINAYFGYRAVARLKIIQGPLPERDQAAPPPQPALSPDQENDLAEQLDSVDNPEIRDRLEQLGRAIKGRRQDREED